MENGSSTTGTRGTSAAIGLVAALMLVATSLPVASAQSAVESDAAASVRCYYITQSQDATLIDARESMVCDGPGGGIVPVPPVPCAGIVLDALEVRILIVDGPTFGEKATATQQEPASTTVVRCPIEEPDGCTATFLEASGEHSGNYTRKQGGSLASATGTLLRNETSATLAYVSALEGGEGPFDATDRFWEVSNENATAYAGALSDWTGQADNATITLAGQLGSDTTRYTQCVWNEAQDLI